MSNSCTWLLIVGPNCNTNVSKWNGFPWQGPCESIEPRDFGSCGPRMSSCTGATKFICLLAAVYTDDRLQVLIWTDFVFLYFYTYYIRKKTCSQPEAFSDGEICGPAALFGCNSFSFLAWRSTLKENSITILLIVIHSMPTCWTKNNKHIVRRKSI